MQRPITADAPHFGGSDITWAALRRLDGIFLAVMGAAGLIMDVASYTGGAGPFGATFLDNPLVIGVIEAHGLALIVGVGVLAGAPARARVTSLQLASAHLLLGACNVAFFGVFERVDAELQGVFVTAMHFGFAAAHLLVLVRASFSTHPNAAS